MSESHDDLYTKVHPDYFATQAKDLFWYERLWGVLLDQLEKRTDGCWLLEWGSGPGHLLGLAKRRGWMVVGFEPSSVARDHARKLGVISVEPTTPEPWAHGLPHAAIATEVLEHVDDPEATLRNWGEVLCSDGLLALSVPNDNNPLQRLFGKWISPDRKTPKWWIHPTHRHYFNRHSLKAVVESAGFEVVWQGSSFPVELLLAIPLLPRKAAWKLSRLWPAPPLLWRFRVGRHCLLVARKAT